MSRNSPEKNENEAEIEDAHNQELNQEKFEKIKDCGNVYHDYCCGTYETQEFQDDKGNLEEVEIIIFDCGCKAIVLGE